MYKYSIHDFPDYYLDENNRLFNVKTGRELLGSLNGSGYLFFHLRDGEGIERNMGLHRLVALAHLLLPVNYKNLVVNHLDGNKGNNSPRNLEWCTYRENLIHAGETGLTSKVVSVEVRNVKTNQVFRFDTQFDCAAMLEISRDAVSYRCKQGPQRMFNDFNQYRSPATGEPWPEVNIEAALRENGNCKHVVVRSLVTGVEQVFERLKDAALRTGCNYTVLSSLMKEKKQPVIRKSFQIKSDFDEPWEEPDMTSGRQSVRVVDEASGKEAIYYSLQEAADANGLKKTTLSFRLKTGEGKLYQDGKRFFRHNSPLQLKD